MEIEQEERERETDIGIKLADEAGEVVVLEIGGEEGASELGRVPDHEAVLGVAPRHDVVRGRVVHHVVRLHQERRRAATSAAAAAAGAGAGRRRLGPIHRRVR